MGLEDISAVPFGWHLPRTGALAFLVLRHWQRLAASIRVLRVPFVRNQRKTGLGRGQLDLSGRRPCQPLSTPTFYRQTPSPCPEWCTVGMLRCRVFTRFCSCGVRVAGQTIMPCDTASMPGSALGLYPARTALQDLLLFIHSARFWVQGRAPGAGVWRQRRGKAPGRHLP